MNEETKMTCSTKTEQTASEITKVILTIEKELACLEESISRLSQRINPILEKLPETPPTISGKECNEMTTGLGENLQQKAEKIISLQRIIRNLIERIAL